MALWSDWLSYTVAPNYSGCAIYQFRKLVDGTVVPVPRWGGTDPEGILVIGETQNMFNRWRQSRSAIDKGYGSSTLNLLHYVVAYSGFTDQYQERYSFEYRFLPAASKEEAQAEESHQITRYICRFWEPPPLNGELPQRYADDLWDKCSDEVFPPTTCRK